MDNNEDNRRDFLVNVCELFRARFWACSASVRLNFRSSQRLQLSEFAVPESILSRKLIFPTAVIDHSDREIKLIEALVGGKPPFNSGGGYEFQE